MSLGFFSLPLWIEPSDRGATVHLQILLYLRSNSGGGGGGSSVFFDKCGTHLATVADINMH